MKYIILTLSGRYHETENQTKSLASRSEGKVFQFDKFLILIEKIISDKKIKKVLIDCKNDFSVNFYQGALNIKQQLSRLDESGKEVWFFSREYSGIHLYLASGCSKRAINPFGTLKFMGISRNFLFFKRFLKKQNIDSTIIRRGKFKSAGDAFRSETIDESNRVQHEAILDTIMDEIIHTLTAFYGKTKLEIDELLQGNILSAEEAQKNGWIDNVTDPFSLCKEWEDGKIKRKKITKLRPFYGKGKKIAVLTFDGAIAEGESRQDALLGRIIGCDSYIPHIKKIADDNSIKGVVFRINSGGGSGTASEEVVNAIAKLREKKPVVVSMSEVAGSGGYWIGLQSEKIFAGKMTITGSIGVISMWFYLQNLLKKYGITHNVLKQGDYADIGSPFRKMSHHEWIKLDSMIDKMYWQFIDKVALARNMSHEEIHNIAEGRIWTGEKAKEIGLIDEVGDLSDAIRYLQKTLGLKKTKVCFYPRIKHSFVERLLTRHYGGIKMFSSESELSVNSILTSELFSMAHKALPIMPESLNPYQLSAMYRYQQF